MLKKILRRPALLLLPAALAFALVLSFFSSSPPAVTASASNTNWGLSFQKKGEAPVGNATSEYLAGYNARYLGNTQQKTIYLTFDCGFENGCTAPILDALKKHNAKATFFVVGNYLETAPELVQRMAEEGHIVGNHTYHHPDMSQIADLDSFRKELTAVEEKYKEITKEEMKKYYRPPQGKFSESNLE